MRPACLRNARSLASAPSPLLPLLAPRAFSEAPFFIRRHDSTPQKEQDQTRRGNRGSVLAWNTEERAYADVFRFARQQLRSYSTAPSQQGGRARRSRGHGPQTRSRRLQRTYKSEYVTEDRVRTKDKRAAPRIRIRKNIYRFRRVAPLKFRRIVTPLKFRKAVKQFNERAKPKYDGSSRPERKHIYLIPERRRLARLKQLRESLEIFERRELSRILMPKSLDGKYRSLRRRILVHSTTRLARVVDLSEPILPGKGKRMLMAFGALDRKVYPGLNRRSYPIVIQHHPMCSSWTARLFNDADTLSANQVWRNWNAFDSETREQYWRHLLIYILDKFPYRALPYLQALMHPPCVESMNPSIIADAFEHLARVYFEKNTWKKRQIAPLEQTKPDFIPTFHHIFREHLAIYNRLCSQDLLYCLSQLADIEDFSRLYELLENSGTNIGRDVLLHYVNTFAKAGGFRKALRCLKIVRDGAESEEHRVQLANTEKFRWSCALTLHGSMVKKDNYHETTGIVAALVDLGVELDILLYNVIINIAMAAGDHETAFKVYNTLDDNGLKPDKYTFSTLLHGCTINGDPSRFNDFAKYCAETAKEIKDPWLASDYLYYKYVRLRRELPSYQSLEPHQQSSQSSEESFDRTEEILQVYLRYFDSRPLRPFWPADFKPPQPSAQPPEDSTLTESAFMDPPPVALYLMLQLEILKASSVSKDRVWALYQRFTQVVQSQYDPTLSKLAKEPIIWNAFLLSFCRAQTFDRASQLVHDMSAYGCTPNIYTWNIFMQGFFKARQIHAAERVFEIMRARGVEPDQFSYEVMLRGYARAQHVRNVGIIMEHVDKEKQDDPKLLRDLARVHEQQKMLFELERARVAQEERERLEKEEKEREIRKKWAPPKFEPLVRVQDTDANKIPRLTPLIDPGMKPGLRLQPILRSGRIRLSTRGDV